MSPAVVSGGVQETVRAGSSSEIVFAATDYPDDRHPCLICGRRTAEPDADCCRLCARVSGRGIGHAAPPSDIPLYRSAAYDELDDDDPRKIASMKRAADCWWADGTDEAIGRRLLDEIALCDHIARWRIRQAGADVWRAGFDPRVMGVDSHGQTLTWKRRADLTPFAELKRLRRYEPEEAD